MNRREIIKGLTAIGALSILPTNILFGKAQDKPLHFIGMGGAGRYILKHFHQKGIQAKYTCIDSRLAYFWYPFKDQSATIIEFLPKDVHFLQLNYHLGIRHELEDKNDKRLTSIETKYETKIQVSEEVTALFNKNERYVLFAGLGGDTGTFFVEKLTLMLHESKKDFLTICSLPFSYEGKNRKTWADNVRLNLQSIPNFKYFDLNGIREKHGNQFLADAFAKANEQFYTIYNHSFPKV